MQNSSYSEEAASPGTAHSSATRVFPKSPKAGECREMASNESLKRTAAGQFDFVSSGYSGMMRFGDDAGFSAAVVYFHRSATK
jgi:hypothetical protein